MDNSLEMLQSELDMINSQIDSLRAQANRLAKDMDKQRAKIKFANMSDAEKEALMEVIGG